MNIYPIMFHVFLLIIPHSHLQTDGGRASDGKVPQTVQLADIPGLYEIFQYAKGVRKRSMINSYLRIDQIIKSLIHPTELLWVFQKY